MRRCEVYVVDRRYSSPGQCAIRRDVRAVAMPGEEELSEVRACAPHRLMIRSGRKLSIVRSRP